MSKMAQVSNRTTIIWKLKSLFQKIKIMKARNIEMAQNNILVNKPTEDETHLFI